jgi:hypothetical protein
MAGKKKTTFAKLARESRLRERRLEKQARKDARKQAAGIEPAQPSEASADALGGRPPLDEALVRHDGPAAADDQ